MGKKSPFFAFLFLFTQFCFGQQLDTLSVGHRISELTKQADKYVMKIQVGSNAGLSVGAVGSVWGKDRAEVPNHVANHGDATIIEVTSDHAVLEANTTSEIFNGDLVFLHTVVPNNGYRSPAYYLWSYGIELLSDDGKPLYTFEEIAAHDGRAYQTEKFNLLKSIIVRTGQNLKAAKDKRKVVAGPHAGKLLTDVLVATDTLDVWLYMYYVTQDYMKTMGQTFKLSEHFGQYAMEGDLIAPDVLRQKITSCSDDDLPQFIKYYRRRTTPELVNQWIEDLRTKSKEGDYETAKGELPRLVEVAELIKAPEAHANAVYLQAGLAYSEERYEDAISYYLEAAHLYSNSPRAGASVQSYLALSYLKTNDIEKAESAYKEQIRLLESLPQSEAENAQLLYDALKDFADYFSTFEKRTQAEEVYRQALKVAQRLKSDPNVASMLWNIAYQLDAQSKLDEAITLYKQASTLFIAVNDTASAIEVIRNCALLSNRQKKFTDSNTFADAAMALAKANNNQLQVAYVHELKATIKEETQDWKLAIPHYLEAETIYRSVPDTTKLLSVLKSLGNAYGKLKDTKKSTAKHLSRVALTNDLVEKGNAYWDAAYYCTQAGEFKQSNEIYKKSISAFQEAGDTANLKTIYVNVAFNYRDLNDSLTAYAYGQRAIELTKTARDQSLYAYSLEKTGKIYSHFKNFTRQIQLHQVALRIYQQLNDAGGAGRIAEEIATSYQAIKNFASARDYFKIAIDHYHEANDKPNEAETYWDYAYNFGTNMGEYRKAIELYQTAFDVYMSVPDSANASTMLSNIGQNYWSTMNYDKAIEYHKKAIDLASRCKNMKRVANSWSKLATLYSESNNPVSSFEALKNSVAALKTVNDSTELANTYTELADNYLKARDYGLAITTYNKALDIRKALRDSIGWANNVANIGGVYYGKSDYASATNMYQESLALRRRIKDKQGQVYSLANLAAIEQFARADYKKAESYVREGIRLATEVKDDYILAYCYGSLKTLYKAQGKIELAQQYSKTALDLYTKIRNWKSVASTLVDIGYDTHYGYGDAQKAMQYFDQAQALIDSVPDSYVQASIYSSRASVYRETGEFDKAIEMSNKSFQLYKQLDNLWGMAGDYIDMGNICKQRSEYEEAIAYQLKADSLYLFMHTDYARLAPLANLGEIYTAQGDYKKGLEYYQRSLAIMEKAGDLNDNLAIIKGCVGEAYLFLNNYDLSDKTLKESLVICDKIHGWRPKADNLSVLGRLKIEEKKYDEALTYLNEGIKLSKTSGMTLSYVTNLLLLGKAEAEQKHFDKAKVPLEESVKISRSIGKRATLWEGLYLLGILYKNAGDLNKSKDYLKESVQVIEEIRHKVSGGDEARKLFSSDKQIIKVYDALIDVLLQLGQTEEAMTYLQKNNEENLKAKFKSLDVKYESENRNRALADERAMKAKLDGIEEQIAKEKMLAADKQNVQKLKSLEGIKTIAESEYLKFINQQINVQPELSRLFNNSVQPTQFRKVKKQIPKDMALLSYLAGENQLYIFVATTDTVVAKIVAVPSIIINKNVNAILNVTKNHMGSFGTIDLAREKAEREELVTTSKQTDQYLKPFEELYHFLISPVADEIVSKKRLGVIPTGALNYIPFQMLGKTLSSGKFSLLANQFAIFYTSSTDMLFRLMQEEDKNINILAFGNPDKTLPSTEKEVQTIKQLYPSATVYLRDDATEDKAKFASDNYNVMHFATHGNLDYEDFTKSFLTMAGNPSKSEDGMLTLEELWGMDVMNHLNIVVLSACQTAVTKGSNESSPVSPASGFLQNGVKSVVATLWKVDDEATSLLVADFYKNLKSMEAIDALRGAQISLSQNAKFSHPYYWAGMVLLGDWR